VANGIIKPLTCMNIQVANLTKKTIIIHPGQKLATMLRLNQAQVNAIHQAERLQKETASHNLTAEIELDLSETNLTQQQRDQLKKLIQSFSDIFRKQYRQLAHWAAAAK
jgi:Spy/CpxP family protein refolding chaperone